MNKKTHVLQIGQKTGKSTCPCKTEKIWSGPILICGQEQMRRHLRS